MSLLRRVCWNRKALTNCIYTSRVKNQKKSGNSGPESGALYEKEDPASKKAENSEEVKQLNAFSSASGKNIKKPPRSQKQKKSFKEPVPVKFRTDFFRQIFSSAEDVAKTLGGNENEIKEDLVDYIKTFEVSKKRDRDNEIPQEYRKEKKASLSKKIEPIYSTDINSLFKNVRGFGVFPTNITKEDKNQVELKTWDALKAENLKLYSALAPSNHFEELIQWTNEGKLWHFPINNDQGLEEEAKVSFTEHIFLEQHLEPWCPKKGPLRRFMDLVLIGLAKNPYLTVEEKKEHINWFEKYFESKKKLLQELGAVGATKELDASSQESPGKE